MYIGALLKKRVSINRINNDLTALGYCTHVKLHRPHVYTANTRSNPIHVVSTMKYQWEFYWWHSMGFVISQASNWDWSVERARGWLLCALTSAARLPIGTLRVLCSIRRWDWIGHRNGLLSVNYSPANNTNNNARIENILAMITVVTLCWKAIVYTRAFLFRWNMLEAAGVFLCSNTRNVFRFRIQSL